MRRPILALTVFGVVAGITAPATADDWPQWLGPKRDSVWREIGIFKKFPNGGPKKLWSADIHGGYAGPAVSEELVVVTDWHSEANAPHPKGPFDTDTRVPGKERVLAFNARTGQPAWKHEYPCPYQLSYGTGPRCTPTIHDGKVYTLGAMGDLYCLSAKDGKPIWQKNFPNDYKAKTPTWGFCGHPLVYQDKVICLVGGPGALVVAFDRLTGKEIWKTLSPTDAGEAGYSPPTLYRVGDQDRLVQFHPTGLTAIDPSNGKPLWTVALKPEYKMSIMAPRESQGMLFTAAIGGQGVTLRLSTPDAEPEVLWRGNGKTDGIYPVNMTPFIDDEVVYGVDQPGMLRAVELKTGKRLWHTFLPVIGTEHDEDFNGAGSGTAFLVKNGDHYFVFNEKGELIIARLTPKGYEEIDKAKLLEPTGAAFGRRVVWSHPAYAHRCIFVRNDKQLVCYRLAP